MHHSVMVSWSYCPLHSHISIIHAQMNKHCNMILLDFAMMPMTKCVAICGFIVLKYNSLCSQTAARKAMHALRTYLKQL